MLFPFRVYAVLAIIHVHNLANGQFAHISDSQSSQPSLSASHVSGYLQYLSQISAAIASSCADIVFVSLILSPLSRFTPSGA
jgi:hypothetical protein